MKKFINVLALFSIMLFTSKTFAGLLLEPYAGYNYTDKVEAEGKDSSGSGLGIGAKVGYQAAMGLQGGIDYLMSSNDMSSSDFKNNVDTSEFGVFVGFKFPVLFKTYLEYIASAGGDTKVQTENINFKSGTGFKFGVGCTILPFLDINLDYRKISFNDSRDFGAYMLSISLPFNLF